MIAKAPASAARKTGNNGGTRGVWLGSAKGRPIVRIRRHSGKRPPDPGLRDLVAIGGGGYFELSRADDLAATFARVADELHHQYLLAFPAPAADGKVHTLDVRVKPSSLTVRARRSYVAPGK